MSVRNSSIISELTLLTDRGSDLFYLLALLQESSTSLQQSLKIRGTNNFVFDIAQNREVARSSLGTNRDQLLWNTGRKEWKTRDVRRHAFSTSLTKTWKIQQIPNLEERARCSQRHVQGHLTQYELYPARLPHQHLPYQTVPQVFQIAAVFFFFSSLFTSKLMFTRHKSSDRAVSGTTSASVFRSTAWPSSDCTSVFTGLCSLVGGCPGRESGSCTKNSSSRLLRVHLCSRSDRTSGSGRGGGLKMASDFFISISSGSCFTEGVKCRQGTFVIYRHELSTATPPYWQKIKQGWLKRQKHTYPQPWFPWARRLPLFRP